MQKTELVWFDGEFKKLNEVSVPFLTHSLHYGSAVFEGIRFFETKNGPAIFRLKDHVARLFYSARSLNLKINFSEKEIFDAIVGTVAKNKIQSGYIRPLIFCGEKMGLSTIGAPVHVGIAVWGWGSYLGDKPLKVCVSKFIRIHPRSTVADAKISGHYVNSSLAAGEAAEQKCDEALLLDFEGNVAEGPGENIFAVKNEKLFTPKLGNILAGITRASAIEIAREKFGIETEEITMDLDFVKSADELFFTGTAAEISAIGILDDAKIGDGAAGEITKKLQTARKEIVAGRDPEFEKWLTFAG